MTRAIEKAGSVAAWGRSIGIGKSYAHEVHAGDRPASDAVLLSLGLVKTVRERFLEI